MSVFITVEKNGETIDVHPLSLENHLQLGWKIVIEPSSPVDAVSVETASELALESAPEAAKTVQKPKQQKAK